MPRPSKDQNSLRPRIAKRLPTNCRAMAEALVAVATLRRSLFINDPKGQIAAIALRERRKLGTCIVIDPSGKSGRR